MLAAGLFILARSPALYAPDKHFGEPSVLAAIDRAVPANAALLLRTNEAFFRRFLHHDGMDRLWFPLGFDDHQLPVRWHRITSTLTAADRGEWIRQGLDAGTAPEMVDALLAEGRPVYLGTVLAFQVPFMAALLTTLGNRYTLAPVASLPNGNRLFRIVPRPAAGVR